MIAYIGFHIKETGKKSNRNNAFLKTIGIKKIQERFKMRIEAGITF